ncbi:monooxygenase [Leptolyngbya sp. Heron Island J]|uniref:acyl-CoA dehydrogenase family protein n=1 Tax=Leptolyngbya sp. Heron Island J TaxID=1385935 RepID=UPI0003B9CD1F|nr:acyl-CoA dehydrogenase family protein [Leptolyngbya sp. Heron Island J]ESA38606.1 monooxygenase [Leptolyngbya sp. Heron Island J]
MTITLQSHIDYQSIAETVAAELKKTALERDRKAGVPTYEINLLRDAGLLPLVVPKPYGGIGANWIEAMTIIKTIAKGDAATAQLYAYHLILSATPMLSGSRQQAEQAYRETAQYNLFWANAINVRDPRLTIEATDHQYRLNGEKTFCTGAAVADRIIGAAMASNNPIPVLFVVPRDRQGLIYNHNWHTMGQRRTASGSFTFDQVELSAEEILGPPPNPDVAIATFLGIHGLLLLSYIFLGIAEAAFEDAREYTCNRSKPWLTSGVDQAVNDPYLQRNYGQLWAQLRGANALADQVAQQVQQAWDKGDALTHAERGEVAISAASAKVITTEMALTVTNRMFELMGARSTAASYGFDRYWRDLRTLSLHDPLDYKLQEIGAWVLNGTIPTPSPYG